MVRPLLLDSLNIIRLVAWNLNFNFPYIGNVIIPTDSYFSEGWRKKNQPVCSQILADPWSSYQFKPTIGLSGHPLRRSPGICSLVLTLQWRDACLGLIDFTKKNKDCCHPQWLMMDNDGQWDNDWFIRVNVNLVMWKTIANHKPLVDFSHEHMGDKWI